MYFVYFQLFKQKEDAEKRCEIFSAELRALESTIDSRISDFQNEARVKTFELDRLQVQCTSLSKFFVIWYVSCRK